MTNINTDLSNVQYYATSTGSTTTDQNASGSTAVTPDNLPDGTYVITTPDNGSSWVPLSGISWDPNNLPPYVYADGRLFKYYQQANASEFVYKDVNYVNDGRGLLRIGYLSDLKYVQTGTQTTRVQVGEKDVVVGYQDVVVGTEQVQVGEKDVVTGYQDVVTGSEQVQVGEKDVLTGYQDVVTGTEQVQVGEKDVLTGYQDVVTGTEQVQVGEKDVITGYTDVVVGQRQVQVGETMTHNTVTTTHTLKVSRELDGKNDTGAVGDMLTRGTAVLTDAEQFFIDGKFAQYQVSGLTAENNQVSSSAAKLSATAEDATVLGSDDMYVAGDPVVGGKGNNYQSVSVTPDAGYMTMFEDGLDAGRKVTINSHPQVINELGNKAFTEYGFVVQDDSGKKTTAVLSGGQLVITDAAGKQTKLLPGQEYVVGSATDPVAKFYYKSMPGGANGTNEDRVVLDYFEKLTPDTKAALVAQGVPSDQLDSLRSVNRAAFGFRVPDGQGSYRMSAGVGNGNPLPVTSNNVKTYYDAHFYEPENIRLTYNTYQDVCQTEPIYETQDIIEKQPVYGKEPIYETRDITEKQPVYGKEPIYETRDITEKQPI